MEAEASVATIRSKSFTFTSANGAPAKTPALLMSTSTAPKRLATASAIKFTETSLVTSHSNDSAFSPDFAQAFATACRLATFRATSASRTPRISRANVRANAAPFFGPIPTTTHTGLAMRRF